MECKLYLSQKFNFRLVLSFVVFDLCVDYVVHRSGVNTFCTKPVEAFRCIKGWGGGVGGCKFQPTQFFSGGRMGVNFSRGDFSLDGCGSLPKLVINLTRTYGKLPCKGESYRLGG